MLINRNLPKIELSDQPFSDSYCQSKIEDVCTKLGITKDEAKHFVVNGKLSNSTYSTEGDPLKIGLKNGELKDLSEASEIYNISNDNKPQIKFFITYLK
ncbi:MAG: hypothetical protein HKP14_02945 [Bacteroidia bacterium]|nr:hypothetical protein [Bacteroidia bacterium]